MKVTLDQQMIVTQEAAEEADLEAADEAKEGHPKPPEEGYQRQQNKMTKGNTGR